MAQRTVQYTASHSLNCGTCGYSSVILCVTPAKVGQVDCPVRSPLLPPEPEGFISAPGPYTPITNFQASTIFATLVKQTFVQGEACLTYLFEFVYDDTQLVAGQLLECKDILGVICVGCLTTYIADSAGREVRLDRILDPEKTFQQIRLTTQHGCIYEFADLQLSTDVGNTAIAGSDQRLFVPAVAGPAGPAGAAGATGPAGPTGESDQESFTVSSHSSDTWFGELPPVDGTIISNLDPFLVVTNPSATRSMAYVVFASGRLGLSKPLTGTPAAIYQAITIHTPIISGGVDLFSISQSLILASDGGVEVGGSFPFAAYPFYSVMDPGETITFSLAAYSGASEAGRFGSYKYPSLTFIGNTV